ncbi:MAG: hypothetical protein AAFN74_08890 [Myxococcota bacterium]
MDFLVLQIINFLVLALLLGALLGYVLSVSTVRDVRAGVEQLKVDVAANRKRLSAAETDIKLHKSSLNELRAAYDGLQERLSVHSDRQADLSGQMEGLVAARSALSERTANLASQLAEAQAGLGRQIEATQQGLTLRIDGLAKDSAQRLGSMQTGNNALQSEHRRLRERVKTLGALSSSPAANNEGGGSTTESVLAFGDRMYTVETRLDQMGDQLDALNASEEASKNRLEKLASLSMRVANVEDIQQDLEVRAVALEAAASQVDANRGSIDRVQSNVAALTSRLEHQDRWGQDTEDRIESLESRLGQGSVAEPTEREANVESPQERPNDDLKRIRGVGVALERTLNQEGICRFEQIAAWRPQDIRQMSGALEKYQARILRDDWVAQAQALIEEDLQNEEAPPKNRRGGAKRKAEVTSNA